MAIYLSTFFLSFLGVKLCEEKRFATNRQRKLMLFLAMLPLFLLSAFRYNVGTDFQNYWGHAATVLQGRTWRYNFEEGYQRLVEVIMRITGNPQMVFVITSAMIIYLFWWGIRRGSSNWKISIVVFVLGSFFFSSMNLIRMYIAISLVFVGYTFLLDGKNKTFLFLVLLAVLFHKTALVSIFVLPIWLNRNRMSMRLVAIYLLIFAGVCVLSPKLLSIIQMIYPTYTAERIGEEHQSLIRTVMEVGILIISLWRYKYSTNKDKYYFLLILSITECLCLFSQIWFPYMSRVLLYYQIGQILLIPEIVNSFDEKNRQIVSLAVYGYYLFYVFYSLVIAGSFGVLPYRTFWMN